jgi:hypothetical protein
VLSHAVSQSYPCPAVSEIVHERPQPSGTCSESLDQSCQFCPEVAGNDRRVHGFIDGQIDFCAARCPAPSEVRERGTVLRTSVRDYRGLCEGEPVGCSKDLLQRRLPKVRTGGSVFGSLVSLRSRDCLAPLPRSSRRCEVGDSGTAWSMCGPAATCLAARDVTPQVTAFSCSGPHRS